MKGKPELIPLLVLKGRSPFRREYSKSALAEISTCIRKSGFEKLYILDVDGIERNKPQLDVVQALCNDFSISYEGGARGGANIVDMLVAGADTVYMSTRCMVSLDEIEIALIFTEYVGLRIDWDGEIVGRGSSIEGSSLSAVVQGAVTHGAKDFVVPLSIASKAIGILAGKSIPVKGFAEKPGEEDKADPNCASLIVDYRRLLKVEEEL
jgi:hypothetical protein